MCMTLEMTYFCAELVQLIVSRSDSELEVQRYGMKKKILWLLILSSCKKNCEWDNVKNRPQTAGRFFENQTAETEFSVFEFWGQFGSVFRKLICKIFIGFHTPLFTVFPKFVLAACSVVSIVLLFRINSADWIPTQINHDMPQIELGTVSCHTLANVMFRCSFSYPCTRWWQPHLLISYDHIIYPNNNS